MSQLSEKEQEERVMVLNVVKQYPHISAKDKRTILNTLLGSRSGGHTTEVGDIFAQYDDRTDRQVSLRATIIKRGSEHLEIAVQSQYRDFWVGFLNTLGADVEKMCKDISMYRELQDWDEKLKMANARPSKEEKGVTT